MGPGGGDRPAGVLVAAGAGDNAAAALGLGVEPGDVVVSLGTSGTVFACSPQQSADASGAVSGFADATGRYLPLVCTLNAAKVLDATATVLGTDLDGLEQLARQAPPGAAGLVHLPYLSGERTPNLPHASGALLGMRVDNMLPHNVARAAVEGMLCGLADALDRIVEHGVPVERLHLIGGAARSSLVTELAAVVFAAPVTVPRPDEYVALGAARQAAWALNRSPYPPQWTVLEHHRIPAPQGGERTGREVREAYSRAAAQLYGTS